MNKNMMMLVIVLVVAAVLAFVVLGGDDDSEDDTNASTETTQTTTQTSVADTDSDAAETAEASEAENSDAVTTEAPALTAEEVAAHATAEDCWTIVSGSVYDITEYVPRHPGGEEILRACGDDGTSLFTSRTTNEGDTIGSGTAHSASAANQLGGFLLGVLAQ